MILIPSALAVLLCQDPSPQPAVPAGAARRDIIRLVGGEQITGTITTQRGNYIEVRLDEGTVIGFERTRVASIERGSVPRPPQKPAVAPRDDWFLLHDSAGDSVGYLHALVQTAEDGAVRVSEEWYFTTSAGRTEVTILENADSEMRPRKCFYHERVITKNDRLESERVVTGEVEGSRLVVVTKTLQARDRKTYSFRETARFPLLFREQMRQNPGVNVVTANQELFDVRTGQFKIWKASSVARRKVELAGQPTEVRELRFEDGTVLNTEWIDAKNLVVRREVNGAALVAVRVTEARARRAPVARGATGYNAAVVTSESGSMALWLPNPIWRAHRKKAGIVSVHAPLYDGEVTLMVLDQIPANAQLDTAADVMTRWLKLTVGQEIKVRSRSGVRIREHPAIRLDVAWSVDQPGASRRHRGTCHVFRMGQQYAALFCAAPAEEFDRLGIDFGRILASVQLRPQDVEPVWQGPLLARPPR